MKKDAMIVPLNCGDLIHITLSTRFGRTWMHECVVVASHAGREGGEFRLTQHELDMNRKH